MTKYILEIKLQSPLTSTAGRGRVGVVDCDIAYDDVGLPILPGKRLKGLWREAYRDVVDACKLKKLVSAERIFGKLGEKSDLRGTSIHIGNAELHDPKALSLRPWMKYLQHPSTQSNLHLDDVVQRFAAVRSQTSIDRHTGAALENTFRLTRTLQGGLVFRAQVYIAESTNDEFKDALALGAAALQYIGTARTRGLGKVRCRLIAIDPTNEADQGHDLTEQVLQNLNLLLSGPPDAPTALPQMLEDEDIETVNRAEEVDVDVEETDDLTELSQTSENSTTHDSGSAWTSSTYMLSYRLTLREAAVIPVADGDPNTVVTRQDIPGSHLWGDAAWRYLRQTKCLQVDETFHYAFFNGGLRFLTAYPEANDPDQDEDGELQRTIPIPHSIRKFKENRVESPDEEKLVDLVETLTEDEKRSPKKRLDRRYAMVWPKDLKTQSVKMELNYHHARVSADRSIGRARGNEVPDGGALFQYEALKANQSFQGAVLGSEADLWKLQEWLPTETLVRIGRSRSAQYGEAKLEWVGDVKKLSGLVEWDGFTETREPPDLGKSLIITTLSPLLAVNEYGHPEACFPKQELAEILGLDVSKVVLSESYTRTEMIGGYHTHLRLPRHQWPGIAAGSVFVFDMSSIQGCIKKDKFLKLEHEGLGLRKAEGYGRIAVNRQGNLGLKNTTETQLGDFKVERPGSQIPPAVEDLLFNAAQRQGLVDIRQRALAAANRTKYIPNNTILGKLRLLLQKSPSDAVKSLDALRKPAKEKLERCQIDTSEPETLWLTDSAVLTLEGLFRKAWTEPKSLSKHVVKTCADNLVKDVDEDACEALIERLVNNYSSTLCKAFLDYFLTALHRKSRRVARSRE